MKKHIANIRKSIIRIKEQRLNTTVVLLACCYIDGLGKRKFNGGSEYRFKKYIERYMIKTFEELKNRCCYFDFPYFLPSFLGIA